MNRDFSGFFYGRFRNGRFGGLPPPDAGGAPPRGGRLSDRSLLRSNERFGPDGLNRSSLGPKRGGPEREGSGRDSRRGGRDESDPC